MTPPSADDSGINNPRAVALVSTYPPTACGLATFASNLQSAITMGPSGWHTAVVRLLEDWEPPLSGPVVEQLVAGDVASLRRSQAVLNTFDAVVVQHEYGVYGGSDGDEVIALVEGLEVPFVAVLHTVLSEPSAHQREVLEAVMRRAAAVVVQSEAARQRTIVVHDVCPDDVVVIPHGAAENFSGPVLGTLLRPTVLTWGLLSPGKGVEHGIAALARLRAHVPSASYVVAGRTHPKVLLAKGERYRESLDRQARTLGVRDRVVFDNAYRDWRSLRALVRSVEVVLLPYDSHDQVSSGVLVEALASGKPVVATRFPHAVELLASGAGMLVDHGDVEAMADALERVLYEPGLAHQMAASARRVAAPLLWPVVGACYRDLVDRVVSARVPA